MTFKFLNQYSIWIYVLILVFSLVFWFLLMGASGHGFHLNFSLIECFSLIFMLCGIFIVPFFKFSHIVKPYFKKIIQISSFLILLGTLFVGIYVLYKNITFDYGNDISLIFIGFTYFILLLFIFINGILLKQIFDLLKL